MNFLYVAQNISIPTGGAEISSINLIGALRKLGHTVVILEQSNAKEPAPNLNYDIVLTHLAWSGIGKQIADQLKIPLAYMMHSYEHICKYGGAPAVTGYCNKICSTCEYQNDTFKPDITIANSNFTADILISQYGYDAKVIYPCIEFDMNSPLSTRLGSPLMSRVSKVKGYDRLEDLARRMRNIDFEVIGYQDYKPENVPKNVKHRGHQDKSIFDKASVFISPFRTETYGMAMVEAQFAGIPVIASDLCAVKHDDLIQLGVAVKYPDDIDYWTDALTRALLDRPSDDKIKEVRTFFKERHSPENNAKLLIETINAF